MRAARDYVCVRVTDMQSVDLGRYAFDYDLTMAVLLAAADGTVYHRLGGRTTADPLAWMSQRVLVDVMQATLREHSQRAVDPASARSAKRPPPRTIYDIASFRERVDAKGERPACIHCHTVHDAQLRDRMAKPSFDKDSIWIWPDPDRIGLTMEPLDQARIRSVVQATAADRAGLQQGDRLLTVGDQRILTVHDLQWVLDRMPLAGGPLRVRFRREAKDGAKEHSITIEVPAGFKRTDPLSWSWRSYKWPLRPAPGCGGPLLREDEKKRLGLHPAKWAFRVQYIVDWGDTPEQGRENLRQGLRKGDVVFSYAGRDDFASMDHFHAWTRLRRSVGERVHIGVLRDGKRLDLVVELK